MKGKPLWALGCMSGTSLDGVDAALVLTDGERVLEQGPSAYRPYSATERAALRAVLGRWPGPGLEAALAVVQSAHAEIISGFQDVEIVGFHGQTLAHGPRGAGTHQLGDGAALSQALGVPVVWDFRSVDVSLGGEGAPLAPIYHWAVARHARLENPVCFLNLGGVGNLTYVDPSKGPEAILAFDTGPANAPIDDLVLGRTGQPFDTGGALAAEGQIVQPIIDRLLDQDYFVRKPPKSLDRNDFYWLLEAVCELETPDAVATLTACAAAAVAAGVSLMPQAPSAIVLCGGGRKNNYMKQSIAKFTSCDVTDVDALGFDGDMIEAQAFGFMAVRVLNGAPTSFPGTTGVAAPVGGGVTSGLN
ncbi:anhydro-N-acetylmuramic acid kinase [Dinoroseobacter shibae DFL 12 = DSM 16493]|jgi:anhydro-N-acetylmuramic acid kinase|uniref:Anhydro-N-acetylmuramic acid kinase n=1 Tax=Dinoroseobacter shibae (strain DSM 16493 / NCIMB 14021 / DFL 12) TaxID=398580 RepID=A8LQL9_DINSH|nr:anhydro-N-acetylmuramic acid kinase [Dinoroseobacter shibae]ABV93886.1 anhydro-N-acetylmuramic acid kinase [Dinoroseobacter shibae DFL 12 = DSM 16493]URF45336.1 anhydro-N-acetylmuramic acid kinase [Dinoroseobacter shibae]URF49641.1 anhydro-N-acetylmuramic acid kinase [Dinoroseobacter shibae]